MALPDRRGPSLAKSYQTNQPNLYIYLLKLRRKVVVAFIPMIRSIIDNVDSDVHHPLTHTHKAVAARLIWYQEASNERKKSINGV